MDTNTLLIVFVAITSIAVVIQMGILVALFVSTRKTAQRVEAIGEELRSKAIPLLESSQALLAANRANVDELIANVTESSRLVRSQLENANVTVSELLGRARAHVERADKMVGRTIDRVEHATDSVRNAVDTPVRHFNGIIQGISVALATMIGRRPNGRVVPKEDMFI